MKVQQAAQIRVDWLNVFRIDKKKRIAIISLITLTINDIIITFTYRKGEKETIHEDCIAKHYQNAPIVKDRARKLISICFFR